MSRFRGRPMDGLPGRLPAGEEVLWQSAPAWRALARHAFRARGLAMYFAVLAVWRIGAALANGRGPLHAASAGAFGVMLGVAGLGLFLFFAWLIARTSTYTITQKRIVLTFGMALPKSLNLPFTAVQAVELRLNEDGTGDIAISVPKEKRLAYLLLWPHVRAARGRTQPVLRCVPDPERAAAVLTEALAGTPAVAVAAAPARAPALLAQAA